MNRRTFLTTLVRAGAAAAVASVFPVPQLERGPRLVSATELAFTQGPPQPPVNIQEMIALVERFEREMIEACCASFQEQYVLPSMIRSARENLALFPVVELVP